MERHALMDAADWFVRLQDQKVHTGTREKFTEWLLLSPDHVAAYIEVAEMYGMFGAGLRNAPSVEELVKAARADSDSSNVVALSTAGRPAMVDEARAPEQQRPQKRTKLFALAASIALLAVIIGWQVLIHADPRYTTQVGEQRSVPLEDGSLVYLNTDSDLSIKFSDNERRITLTRGEARFTVAKDLQRPFIVSTRHATVRALGTIFNVLTGGERTAVSVIEGQIVVTGQADMAPHAPGGSSVGSSRVTLKTGQQVAITAQGQFVRDAGPSLERVMAWPNGHLIFRDEPLIDLVTDFNRYHKQQLRIVDPELAGHRVNGTFDAYDRTSLIEFLKRYEGVRVESANDGSQHLSRAEISGMDFSHEEGTHKASP